MGDCESCEGNRKCQAVAPEVFQLRDDDDEVRILVEDVPPELEERVGRAIRLCPRQALVWRTD